MEVKRVKWSSLFLPVYSEEGANSGEMVNPAAGQMCPEAERKRWGEGGGPPMPSWAAFSSDLIFFFFASLTGAKQSSHGNCIMFIQLQISCQCTSTFRFLLTLGRRLPR